MERVRTTRALSGYVAQALRRMIYDHAPGLNGNPRATTACWTA